MAYGDIHNQTGTICKARTGFCPLGEGEGVHSSNEEAYVDHVAAKEGLDRENIRELMEQGLNRKEAIELTRDSVSTLGTSTKKPKHDFLKESPEGVKRFEEYKKEWMESRKKSFANSEYFSELAERDAQEAARIRANPGTYDGAWIKPQDDGGVEIPAGNYVFVSSDGWRPLNFDDDSSQDESTPDGADKWENHVLTDTPPGAVGAAYLEGKPAYFMTSMSMGVNHGYDGEILVPKETYDTLKSRGYFPQDEEPITVQVKESTVIYGDLGNPKDAPEGLYSWGKSDEAVSPEAKSVYDYESRREGTIFNHPHIQTSETPHP